MDVPEKITNGQPGLADGNGPNRSNVLRLVTNNVPRLAKGISTVQIGDKRPTHRTGPSKTGNHNTVQSDQSRNPGFTVDTTDAPHTLTNGTGRSGAPSANFPIDAHHPLHFQSAVPSRLTKKDSQVVSTQQTFTTTATGQPNGVEYSVHQDKSTDAAWRGLVAEDQVPVGEEVVVMTENLDKELVNKLYGLNLNQFQPGAESCVEEMRNELAVSSKEVSFAYKGNGGFENQNGLQLEQKKPSFQNSSTRHNITAQPQSAAMPLNLIRQMGGLQDQRSSERKRLDAMIAQIGKPSDPLFPEHTTAHPPTRGSQGRVEPSKEPIRRTVGQPVHHQNCQESHHMIPQISRASHHGNGQTMIMQHAEPKNQPLHQPIQPLRHKHNNQPISLPSNPPSHPPSKPIQQLTQQSIHAPSHEQNHKLPVNKFKGHNQEHTEQNNTLKRVSTQEGEVPVKKPHLASATHQQSLGQNENYSNQAVAQEQRLNPVLPNVLTQYYGPGTPEKNVSLKGTLIHSNSNEFTLVYDRIPITVLRHRNPLHRVFPYQN